jgi:hypothetical protein
MADTIDDFVRRTVKAALQESLEALRPTLLASPNEPATHAPAPSSIYVTAKEAAWIMSAHPKFHQDLERLGMRPRRQHDLRRTFISLCLGDGASKDILRWITHAPEGDVVDDYTTLLWNPFCREVAKLQIGLRRPESESANAAISLEALGGRVTGPVTGAVSDQVREAEVPGTIYGLNRNAWRGGRDLKLEGRGTEDPGGTRPWPVSPRTCAGTARRLAPTRAGSELRRLRSDGTTTARRLDGLRWLPE